MLYFAYGANMHSEGLLRKGLFKNKDKGTIEQRRGIAVNRSLVFSVPSGLPIEPACANLVRPVDVVEAHGVIYEVEADDLNVLDQFEKPSYQREEILVKPYGAADQSELVSCITYLAPETLEPQAPSSRYLDLLVAAAKASNLSLDYVSHLKRQASIDFVHYPSRPPVSVPQRQFQRDEVIKSQTLVLFLDR